MTSNLERVLEFHKAFGQDINGLFTEKLVNLRIHLIDEEFMEVLEELTQGDGNPKPMEDININKVSKELADLLYVVYGTGVAFGIPLDAVFEEVHKSNMSKLGEDGKPIYRKDGKVLKGPNYNSPNIMKVLAEAYTSNE